MDTVMLSFAWVALIFDRFFVGGSRTLTVAEPPRRAAHRTGVLGRSGSCNILPDLSALPVAGYSQGPRIRKFLLVRVELRPLNTET